MKNNNTIQIKDYDGNVIFEHTCENNTMRETIKIAAKCKIRFVNVRFERIDFSELDLSNLAFINVTFDNIKGFSTNFINCQFVNCKFNECVFWQARFDKSRITLTEVYATSFARSKLNDVIIKDTTFKFCDLSYINLQGKSSMILNSTFYKTDFIESKISCVCQKVKFNIANLNYSICYFVKTSTCLSFTDVCFYKCDLQFNLNTQTNLNEFFNFDGDNDFNLVSVNDKKVNEYLRKLNLINN